MHLVFKDGVEVAAEIKASPGVYEMDRESGTGKIYLFTLLRELWRQGAPVATLTWEDEERVSDIRNIVSPGK